MSHILSRCLLPLPLDEIIALRLIEFEKWPKAAREPWWWTGTTRSAKIRAGRFHRARGFIQINGRLVSPARPIYEMFTGIKLSAKERLTYNERGVRHVDRDDVNPSHYHISVTRPPPQRKNNVTAKPIDAVLGLMTAANFWPATVQELLIRWPDLATYSEAELKATIEAT